MNYIDPWGLQATVMTLEGPVPIMIPITSHVTAQQQAIETMQNLLNPFPLINFYKKEESETGYMILLTQN